MMLKVVTEIEGEEPRFVYFCFVQWCGDIGGEETRCFVFKHHSNAFDNE